MRIIEADLESLAGEKNTSEGDVLRSIEGYGGGFGDDILTGALSSIVGDWFGESGNDTLFGSSAANTLVGGPGADSLDGNGGTDILDGKSGEGNGRQGPADRLRQRRGRPGHHRSQGRPVPVRVRVHRPGSRR